MRNLFLIFKNSWFYQLCTSPVCSKIVGGWESQRPNARRRWWMARSISAFSHPALLVCVSTLAFGFFCRRSPDTWRGATRKAPIICPDFRFSQFSFPPTRRWRGDNPPRNGCSDPPWRRRGQEKIVGECAPAVATVFLPASVVPWVLVGLCTCGPASLMCPLRGGHGASSEQRRSCQRRRRRPEQQTPVQEPGE